MRTTSKGVPCPRCPARGICAAFHTCLHDEVPAAHPPIMRFQYTTEGATCVVEDLGTDHWRVRIGPAAIELTKPAARVLASVLLAWAAEDPS